jgi:hypothetical protein
MVKIGKYILFEKATHLLEKFKASVSMGYGGKPSRKTFSQGEHSWLTRCKYFDKLADDYPLFNQSCLSLAGLTTAQGVFYSPAVKKNDESYPLAEEAVYRLEKLSQKLRVISKFYETVYRMAKFGAAFWEVTFQPEFDFRLAPFQEGIEPYGVNEIGEVESWRQIINGTVKAEWSATPTNDTYLIIVPWNVKSNTWPYGTSLGVGSETELESLINMETNASAYMEKQAYPWELVGLGNEKTMINDSEYQSAKSEIKSNQRSTGISSTYCEVPVCYCSTRSRTLARNN